MKDTTTKTCAICGDEFRRVMATPETDPLVATVCGECLQAARDNNTALLRARNSFFAPWRLAEQTA